MLNRSTGCDIECSDNNKDFCDLNKGKNKVVFYSVVSLGLAIIVIAAVGGVVGYFVYKKKKRSNYEQIGGASTSTDPFAWTNWKKKHNSLCTSLHLFLFLLSFYKFVFWNEWNICIAIYT